jgi:seryl-tRNA synthetase
VLQSCAEISHTDFDDRLWLPQALWPTLLRYVRSESLLHWQLTKQQHKVSTFRRYSVKYDAPASSASGLPKPRLDYREISENVVYKSHNVFNRRAPLPVGAIQTIERIYAEHKALSSNLNAKRNARSSIEERVRASSKDLQAKGAALGEAKILKAEINQLEDQLATVEERLFTLASAVPNNTHPESPIGPEEAAVTLSTHGPPPMCPSESRDHVSIGRALKLLDLEAGATVTGSSWYYLLNEAALLEMALVNYALSIAIKHGFSPVITPDVVRMDIARRCGFQPRDQDVDSPVSQMYHVSPWAPASQPTAAHPELVLSGTAEIPLAGMFANRIYSDTELPLKVIGLGRAFRAEAGARGADTRGLYRVHQFTKLELFVVATQDQSDDMMEQIRAIQTEIFEGLRLSFR